MTNQMFGHIPKQFIDKPKPKDYQGGDKLKPTDSNAPTEVLSYIYLISRQCIKGWNVEFCPNGEAFGDDDSFVDTCEEDELSYRWNLFVLCPLTLSQCRIESCTWSKNANNI
ncbi:unnamed protein product [Hymenolepis diminuta]|uniref:Chitin-binding type-2 domain-containing protein n=1 Tax=Hymenolepis diminuta TaxID=6216 RepID=A0A0R3SIF1_HYMDI|nr:unnamed protein product [Hymenolepis diminuta]VUZ40158.1 unnamed protein product [Hymenolepis diminuta]